jgi:hypothetical protein
MSPLEAFKRLLDREFLEDNEEEDGEEPYVFTPLPACTEEEIELFASELPRPLPDDIRELLRFSRGLEGGPIDRIDFLGEDTHGGQMLLYPLAIYPDGLGNAWMLDLDPAVEAWGPVYYWCHDPPVLIYQCADLTEFLLAIGREAESPGDNPIDEVASGAAWNVWRNSPEAAASPDEALRSFAEGLGPDWWLFDFRNAKRGEGFSWGRREIEETASHDELPIFAYRLSGSGS